MIGARAVPRVRMDYSDNAGGKAESVEICDFRAWTNYVRH
jgi:hypothetical protein